MMAFRKGTFRPSAASPAAAGPGLAPGARILRGHDGVEETCGNSGYIWYMGLSQPYDTYDT